MTARWQRKQEAKRQKAREAAQFQMRAARKASTGEERKDPIGPTFKYPNPTFGRDFVITFDGPSPWSSRRMERVTIELDRETGTFTCPFTGRRLRYGDDGYGFGAGSAELRGELEAAKAKLVEQNTLLKRLATGAAPLADVIRVNGDTTFVSGGGGQLIAVETPSPPCDPGDQVKLVAETMQIREKVPAPCSLGEVTTVAAVHDDGFCEIKHGGSTRLVVARPGIEPGDRVSLDRTGQVVTRRLARATKPPPASNVTWDSIGGQEDAKRELRDAIELPYKHRELFARYGHAPAKGVLLFGRPGNGKTLLAKAVASSLAEMHGQTEGGFIYVKGPEILDRFVGASEENIRSMFDQAKVHKAKHGHPAVIFIDEAETILGARGSGSFMDRTIVPQFLAEMDGMGESGAFVLLATNRPDSLDPAVVRDGRIDRRIQVCRPDKATATDIFRIHLRGKPTCIDQEELAAAAVKCLFATELVLFSVDMKSGHREPFTLAHVLNGAMIAGLVQRATQRAIRREIETGTADGIAINDIVEAVAQAFREQQHIDHREAVEDFLEAAGEPAQRITKGPSHARAN